MLIDAHFHNSVGLLPLQHLNHIQGIVNSDSLEELEYNRANNQNYISFGIHPWKAEQVPADLAALLASVAIIGEIGMDSVWTQVDLAVQQDVFEQQLAIAVKQHKPVVLHTKGQEREILALIRNYPNRYLIHWYATPDYLAEYLALDTYFTAGPDVFTDKAVQKVAQQVPLQRVLVESDGIDAIAWAQNIAVENVDYVATLQASYQYLAALHGIGVNELELILADNFQRFVHGDS
ncbi:hypothetical protein EQG49_01655 [Periweissella cryptocerci]|uniref:Uncharacterized protein n=1 Tax=Periweissella cryptocerci TaxID=2506420 RepID=A0A4V1AIE8_9LACO|nr:TatD family hydrolase [Periweissella cryptocerci]QBO35255.1 hypothetical protein EQG49_01655 [Periweissella cryptocerci]